MMKQLLRLTLATFLAALTVTAAQSDILVHLKNGQTISIPVAAQDVESISFGQTAPIAMQGAALQAAPEKIAPHLPPAPKKLMGVTVRDGKRVIFVGPTRTFKLPSEAAKAAEDGDIIEIDGGVYSADVAFWNQNNLTIRGIGGRPHMDAAGKSADGKATWVIRGANTTVQNLEFSGSRVSDNNGAGIRQEGPGLIVDGCYFHHNQIGIMSGTNPRSDIIIRNSEFASNALDNNQQRNPGHNIYIGAVRSFTLTNSHIHDARVGHNVKSRAAHTEIIKNRIEDGKSGSSSYLLDLPAGGVAIVRDNYFQKGSKAENPATISYGAERGTHKENRLIVTQNTFVNDNWRGIFIDNRSATAEASITKNRFKGPGAILRGKGVEAQNQVEQ